MTDSIQTAAPAADRRAGLYWRALIREPVTVLALVSFAAIVLSALIGPEIYAHDPFHQTLENRLLPPGSPSSVDSLPHHYLGTDGLGRDVVARLLRGARVSLSVGIAGVVGSGTLGITLGLIAGFFRGRTEDTIMRTVDLQMSFPTLILALFLLFAIGPGLLNLLIVMTFARWPNYARIARGLALGVRSEQYVEASSALGASPWRTLREHVLPNVRSPLLVVATLELARMILFESTLSFLGFGIQPPEASWGLMISEGREYIQSGPWLVIAPGVAIFMTALSANLLASWSQNVLDPLRRAKWLYKGMRKEEGA